MKKIPFALILACGLASGSAFAASNGKVTINGEVVDQTCTITGAADKVVNLATVSKSIFAAAGDTAAPTIFTIELDNCVAGDVYAAFSAETGALIDSSTHTLVNTGTAKNVNIALFEESGQKIQLGNPLYNNDADEGAQAKEVDAGGSTTLVYSAAYYAMAELAAIESGTVTAVANYIIAYK